MPETKPVTVEVMAELWPAVVLFSRLSTQWRCVAGATQLIWLGLDYAAVDVAIRRLGAEGIAFQDLQTIEAAALGVLNGGV